jgi:large subunit ribosomal protein L31
MEPNLKLTKQNFPHIIENNMKTNLHPTYFPHAKVICACGNSFTTGATKEEIRVEICAQCHPFYTGEEKLIDTAGRVEKFKSRRAAKVEPKAKKVRPKKN